MRTGIRAAGARRPDARTLRSIAADDLPPDDLLYREGDAVVMPSWLEIDGRESIAVRSIVRLSLSESPSPRAVARVVCVCAVGLAALSGWHLVSGALPLPLAWLLLAASLALALIASHIAFVRAGEHRLEVHLADGSSVRFERGDRGSLLALHRALSRAMERQRGGG